MAIILASQRPRGKCLDSDLLFADAAVGAHFFSHSCKRNTSGLPGRGLRLCACATVEAEAEEAHGANDLDSQARRRSKGTGGWNGLHLRAPVSGANAERQAHKGERLEPVPGCQRKRWHHVPGAILRFVWKELQQWPRENGERACTGVKTLANELATRSAALVSGRSGMRVARARRPLAWSQEVATARR